MQFGISTHLYHDQKLDLSHLAQVAGYGFESVELFATRSHFDYHDPASVAALEEWLETAGLGAAQRPRADHRHVRRRRPVGADLLDRRRRRREAAGGG